VPTQASPRVERRLTLGAAGIRRRCARRRRLLVRVRRLLRRLRLGRLLLVSGLLRVLVLLRRRRHGHLRRGMGVVCDQLCSVPAFSRSDGTVTGANSVGR